MDSDMSVFKAINSRPLQSQQPIYVYNHRIAAAFTKRTRRKKDDIQHERDVSKVPVRNSFAKAVVQVWMLVNQAVVSSRAVQMDKGRAKSRNETCQKSNILRREKNLHSRTINQFQPVYLNLPLSVLLIPFPSWMHSILTYINAFATKEDKIQVLWCHPIEGNCRGSQCGTQGQPQASSSSYFRYVKASYKKFYR